MHLSSIAFVQFFVFNNNHQYIATIHQLIPNNPVTFKPRLQKFLLDDNIEHLPLKAFKSKVKRNIIQLRPPKLMMREPKVIMKICKFTRISIRVLWEIFLSKVYGYELQACNVFLFYFIVI